MSYQQLLEEVREGGGHLELLDVLLQYENNYTNSDAVVLTDVIQYIYITETLHITQAEED